MENIADVAFCVTDAVELFFVGIGRGARIASELHISAQRPARYRPKRSGLGSLRPDWSPKADREPVHLDPEKTPNAVVSQLMKENQQGNQDEKNKPSKDDIEKIENRRPLLKMHDSKIEEAIAPNGAGLQVYNMLICSPA